MSSLVHIAVVSYTNSLPFLEGFKTSKYIQEKTKIHTYWPSKCVEKVLNNDCQIGLLPVFSSFNQPSLQRISDYGIACDGEVGSVLLMSPVPLSQIQTIVLDYQSKTSVNLVKVLAKKFWNIAPEYKNAEANFEKIKYDTKTAIVLIGDRVYEQIPSYKYIYDLGQEWKNFTHLPFVFAAWYSTKKLSTDFIHAFNQAIDQGLVNIPVLIKQIQPHRRFDLQDYYENKIKYLIGNNEKKGIEKYFNYCKEINLI